MGFVTVKDFGIALGVNGVTVRQRVVRKKLIKNDYGLIDVNHVTNFSYIVEINGGDLSVFDKYYKSIDNDTNVKKKLNKPNKNISFSKPSENKVEKLIKSKETTKKSKNKEVNDNKGLVYSYNGVETKKTDVNSVPEKLTADEKRRMSEQKKANDLILSFEIRKKEAEVKLVERNAELKQWELEKKAGSTLPINMMEKVIAINFKAIFKSIKSQSKNIAMVMVQQLGGSKEDLDSILMQLDDILDSTVKDAEKKSTVDVEKLIEEYSEIRSRGERKV